MQRPPVGPGSRYTGPQTLGRRRRPAIKRPGPGLPPPDWRKKYGHSTRGVNGNGGEMQPPPPVVNPLQPNWTTRQRGGKINLQVPRRRK